MNFLIAGLGNTGERYAATRHNIGFDIADAFIARLQYNGHTFTVIKPATQMNLSGKAVKY